MNFIFLKSCTLLVLSLFYLNIYSSSAVLDTQTLKDMELFTGNSHSTQSLKDVLDRTYTHHGSHYFNILISTITTDTAILTQRQEHIKTLLDMSTYTQVATALERYATYINNNQGSAYSNTSLLDQFYFSNAQSSYNNTSPIMLNLGYCAHMANLALPLFEHAVLHFLVSEKLHSTLGVGCALHKHQHTHKPQCSHKHSHHKKHTHNSTILTTKNMLFYGYNAAHTLAHILGFKALVDQVRNDRKLVHSIRPQLERAHTVLSTARTISSFLRNYAAWSEWNATVATMLQDPKIQHLEHLLASCQWSRTWTGNILPGHLLAAYKALTNALPLLGQLINALAYIEVCAGIAHIMHEQDEQHPFCFTDYISNAAQPFVHAQNIWALRIPGTVDHSTIMLGEDCARSAIITGPNGTGKSTLITQIAHAIILSQTFGIAPARTFTATPFSCVTSACKMSDNISKGHSLFGASIARADYIRSQVKALEDNQFCFIVLDEFFNCTDPQRGQQLLIEFIDEIDQTGKCISLVSTHFAPVAQWAQLHINTSATCNHNSSYALTCWSTEHARTKQGTFAINRGVYAYTC
ncbi:hypothetical protein KG892_04165 [Vermiphilus pyriformis]|nr:MAG: hypothetical protein KG892_04165 [Vermiphilus pyriformis]